MTEYNVGSTFYNTFYFYDIQGNLTQVTDNAGNVTTMSYDLLGLKTAMTDPDMGSWQYQYDAVGNLTGQKDGRNQWVYLVYDDLNRLTGKYRDKITGPMIARYIYDAVGQKGLLSESGSLNSAGTAVDAAVANLAYDARNRVTQQEWRVNGSGTFHMNYTYNEANQKTSVTYPGSNVGALGETVTNSYNVIGQLTGVAGLAGIQYVSSATYNAQGQLTQLVNENGNGANGLTRRWTYETNTLRLSSIQAGTNATFDNLQKLTYSYDNAGNVTSLVDTVNSGQKQCFQYDWLSRLTAGFTGDAACVSLSVTGTGVYNHGYVYDSIGNITTNAGNVYTYGNAAHKHAVTAAFGNSYGYDANGNQTTRTIGGVTYTFTYDYENHLTAVSGGSVSASFVYDADGNRVKGTVNGTTTVYIAGLYEYQGGATTLYYEGNALRRTGYAANNGVFYLLQDQLKSSSVLANQNGTVNSRNYFYPFGGNRGGAAFSSLTTKRFTGQYQEAGLPGGEGLSYYGARWYDAQLGRFTGSDTIVPGAGNPQTLNRYAYTLNNPLRYTDLSGHVSQPISFPDNPGWVQSITCFLVGCTFGNGRVYLTPDPLLIMPVPMAFAEEAGTSIVGGLLRRTTQFFRTGTPPAMQSALAQVLEAGDIVGMRSRPPLARFFQGWFPAKTTGASGAAAVIKAEIGPVDTGIRVAFNGERFSTFVSDLDVGYIVRDGKFLPPNEVDLAIQRANKLYGEEIFTHGDLWSGANAGAKNIEPKHLHSLTHVFEVQNGSLNYWFSGGFMETIGKLLNDFGRLWSK